MEDVKQLQGCAALAPVLTMRVNLAREYTYLYQALKEHTSSLPFDLKQFTFDDYRWASSVVMSRQNLVPVEADQGGHVQGHALIPLWDMMNHEDGKLTTSFDTESGTTQYRALRAFSRGEQIMMCYGHRSSCDHVCHSGFMLSGSSTDFMLLKLGVGKSDPLFSAKSSLLQALSVACSGDFVLSADVSAPEPPLLAFVRINAMTEDELKKFLQDPSLCGCLGAVDGVVSDSNRKAANSFMMVRCQLLLRCYPTSKEVCCRVTNLRLGWRQRLSLALASSGLGALQCHDGPLR
eukprot:m.431194 g.431194  ORF g.431194 m.431194 type:complete len:292 (-) comp20242_c3_seq8:296-1171(-)